MFNQNNKVVSQANKVFNQDNKVVLRTITGKNKPGRLLASEQDKKRNYGHKDVFTIP